MLKNIECERIWNIRNKKYHYIVVSKPNSLLLKFLSNHDGSIRLKIVSVILKKSTD